MEGANDEEEKTAAVRTEILPMLSTDSPLSPIVHAFLNKGNYMQVMREIIAKSDKGKIETERPKSIVNFVGRLRGVLSAHLRTDMQRP